MSREILLGVSGGIAAYKAADLCSKLVQSEFAVSVIMTESATRFVTPVTFQTLSARPVHTGLWDPQEHSVGEHIGLVRRAGLFVIAPATANVIAKIAAGIADDLLTTAVLAATCPVMVAPSMNVEMWSKPATQRNVSRLRDDGIGIIDPGEGWMSCRESGAGRMVEPDEILEVAAQFFANRPA